MALAPKPGTDTGLENSNFRKGKADKNTNQPLNKKTRKFKVKFVEVQFDGKAYIYRLST
jgi:hypothetical protein